MVECFGLRSQWRKCYLNQWWNVAYTVAQKSNAIPAKPRALTQGDFTCSFSISARTWDRLVRRATWACLSPGSLSSSWSLSNTAMVLSSLVPG